MLLFPLQPQEALEAIVPGIQAHLTRTVFGLGTGLEGLPV